MNKFSRIRHHVDMKDVKERHLEEFIEKKKEEKRISEEREAINAEYQRWKFDWRNDIKGFDHFGEGMTTQMLTGVLPSAGNADLNNLQLGLTGEGDINYGEGGPGDGVMAGEGQYTCFSNLDILDNVDEPNNTGTRLRVFDQDSKQFRNQGHGGGEHGYLLAMPGYQRGMLRNVKPLGDYNAYDRSYRTNKGLPLKQNGTSLYYHIYGQTNDVLGKGYGSWNSNDGVTNNGMGVVLSFNGPGSPRYVALKAIDSTEFDTIKIHAAVSSNSMVSDYRDSDGVLRDKKVQVYYWAGDHKDYVRHPSASGIYDGNKTASQDGWRPINMKPNGELDDTVDPYIIKLKADRDTHGVDANGVTYDASGKLHPYSLPLPEYTRGKNARYIIVQTDKNNFSDDNAFALASVRFQRKNTLRVPSISKPLTDIEAAPFVRVGQGVDQNAKQRKKRVRDMINASIKYGNMKFGKGMFNSTNLDDDLEEEKKLKEEKICSRIAKKKKSNWRKDLAESDWSPVTSTIANRATQTFQHDSGGTATFAGLGGAEVHPDQVTLDLGFGETIDVSPPTYSDLALAGLPMPVAAADPMARKLNKRKGEEINNQLQAAEDAALRASGAAEFMKGRVDTSIEPNTAEKIAKAGWTFGKYLIGDLKPGNWNDYLGEGYVQNAFRTGSFKSDNGGVSVGDNVIGSAGKLVYDNETDSYKMEFQGLGFKDNKNQFKEKEYDIWRKALYTALGPHSADAQPSLGAWNPIGGLIGVLSGLLITTFKLLGKAKDVDAFVTYPADKLVGLNKNLANEFHESKYFTPPQFEPLMPPQSLSMKEIPKFMSSPAALKKAHEYYYKFGRLPAGSVPTGKIEHNYMDHWEYDPKVIREIGKARGLLGVMNHEGKLVNPDVPYYETEAFKNKKLSASEKAKLDRSMKVAEMNNKRYMEMANQVQAAANSYGVTGKDWENLSQHGAGMAGAGKAIVWNPIFHETETDILGDPIKIGFKVSFLIQHPEAEDKMYVKKNGAYNVKVTGEKEFKYDHVLDDDLSLKIKGTAGTTTKPLRLSTKQSAPDQVPLPNTSDNVVKGVGNLDATTAAVLAGKKKKKKVNRRGRVITTESTFETVKQLRKMWEYEGKPSPNGFPDNPPPKLKNGWHPEYGNKDAAYNRLDPESAKAMPETGNPKIDKKVKKAKKQAK